MKSTKQRLRAWRLGAGLSQDKAAYLAGMSQPAWCGYENDDVLDCPGINAAMAIEELTAGEIVVADWRALDAHKTALRKAVADNYFAKRAARPSRSTSRGESR